MRSNKSTKVTTAAIPTPINLAAEALTKLASSPESAAFQTAYAGSQNSDPIRLRRSLTNTHVAGLGEGEEFKIADLCEQLLVSAPLTDAKKAEKVRALKTALDRLVDRGVLERASEGCLRRSRVQVEVTEPQKAFSSRQPANTLDLGDLCEEIIRMWRDPSNSSTSPAVSFGPWQDTRENSIRLAYYITTAGRSKEYRTRWNPPITDKQLVARLFEATGLKKIGEFKPFIMAKLKEAVSNEVTGLVLSKLEAECGLSAGALAASRKEVVQAVRVISSPKAEPAEIKDPSNFLAEKLVIKQEYLVEVVQAALRNSKTELLNILRQSPLIGADPERIIAFVENRSNGEILRTNADSSDIAIERVRQILDSVETIDPLIRLIIRVRPSRAAISVREREAMIAEQRKFLESYVADDPNRAYQEGKEANPSLDQLEGENGHDALKRMFLAGWAGQYREIAGSVRSSACLRAVASSSNQRGVNDYFRTLARQIANARLTQAASADVQIDKDRVLKIIDDSPSWAAWSYDVEEVVLYLKKLVMHPRSGKERLWRDIYPNTSFSGALWHPFEAYVREMGTERARFVAELFSENWINECGVTDRQREAIGHRVLAQRSLQEAASLMNTTLSAVNSFLSASIDMFPALGEFLPRKSSIVMCERPGQ